MTQQTILNATHRALGAKMVDFGGWDMPAVSAMGDSALGVFWEPKEIKPGDKRENDIEVFIH